MSNFQKTIDTATILKAAGLVAVSAAGATVIDTGGGYTEGKLEFNVTAVEVDTGDELYTIALQGSNTAAFGGTDIVDLCSFQLGDAAVLPGASDLTTGVHVMPFCNTLLGTTYRYLRVYTTVAGTIATGINYEAYISK